MIIVNIVLQKPIAFLVKKNIFMIYLLGNVKVILYKRLRMYR